MTDAIIKVRENMTEELKLREVAKCKAYFQRRYLQQAYVTQDACDVQAMKLKGGPIVPVPCQGLCSYSVFAGENSEHVISFREETIGEIHIDDLALAAQIHGDIVPAAEPMGDFGPLKIFIMPRLDGKALSDTCHKEPGPLPAQVRINVENTIKDLAVFYKQSWNSARAAPKDDERIAEFKEFVFDEMDYFLNALPVRHDTVLQKIIDHLPFLFEDDFPFVLTHLDMLPWNILVKDDGHVSGIIDWWDAKRMPFGVALHGRFFNCLGYMDEAKNWHFYEEHQELEALFWSEFHNSVGPMTDMEKRTMELAQMVGLYLRFGSTWDESLEASGGYRPSRDGDEKMAYLDAAIDWISATIPFWNGVTAPRVQPGATGTDNVADWVEFDNHVRL